MLISIYGQIDSVSSDRKITIKIPNKNSPSGVTIVSDYPENLARNYPKIVKLKLK